MKTVTLPVPSRRDLAKVAAIILIAYLAYVVRQIWLPLALAVLLAMVLDPIVDRMELNGWSRRWASTFIFGSFLLVVVGLAILAYPVAVREADVLQAGFAQRFPDQTHAGLTRSLHALGMPAWVADGLVASYEHAANSVRRSSDWIANFGLSVAANVVWVVLVPIVAYYALCDFHTILAKGLLLVPTHRRDLVQTAVTEITGVFGKYLRGLAIVSVLNGVATGLLLWALQVPGAAILGVTAGVLYSVPYIGALLTILMTGAFAFVGGGVHLLLVAVAASILMHQVVFDLIVSPRLLGGHVGLHPILAIFALVVGNLLLGIIGMVLAVPVAACIQVAVLALVPKLSHKIEVSFTPAESPDSVETLAEETKHADASIDATQEIHASVISAVESIEQEVEESD